MDYKEPIKLGLTLDTAAFEKAFREMGYSPRELEVLKLALQGFTGKRAAAILKLHPKTICTYWGRVLQKSGTNNVVELAVFAAQKGIIRVEQV